MKPREQRREEAQARQARYDALSAEQKLAELDAKFGPGQGARKQRERLQAVLEKKS